MISNLINEKVIESEISKFSNALVYKKSILQRNDSSTFFYKKFFSLSYILFNILKSPMHRNDLLINVDYHNNIAKQYIIENLLENISLINREFMNPSVKNFRTILESQLRYIISIEYTLLKNENRNLQKCKNKDSNKLKSVMDTHKIGKLTSKAKEYYKSTVISDNINRMNSFYSKYSNTIHSSDEKTEFKEYFEEQFVHNEKDFIKLVSEFCEVIGNCLVTDYYEIKIFNQEELFGTSVFSIIVNLFKSLGLDYLVTKMNVIANLQ